MYNSFLYKHARNYFKDNKPLKTFQLKCNTALDILFQITCYCLAAWQKDIQVFLFPEQSLPPVLVSLPLPALKTRVYRTIKYHLITLQSHCVFLLSFWDLSWSFHLCLYEILDNFKEKISNIAFSITSLRGCMVAWTWPAARHPPTCFLFLPPQQDRRRK